MLCCSTIKLDKKKAYFIYIGIYKSHELAGYLTNTLKKKYKKEVEPIYIFPNNPPAHFKGQYCVINKKLKEICKKKKGKHFCNLTNTRLLKQVSKSAYIIRLIKDILKSQEDLYIKPFKTSAYFTLHKRYDGVKIIGPAVSLFTTYNKKLFQRELADTLGIRQPEWFLVHNKEDLISTYTSQFKGKPAFVTKITGSGGQGSAFIKNKKELLQHPHIKQKHRNYLISKKIDARASPSAEAIVANDQEVFFTTVIDQIMDGPSYLGNIYPSKQNKNIQKEIENYTIKIGKYLGRHGYRGFFSVDYVIDKKGKVYFTEINPRNSGSSTEKVCMHEVTKNKGTPSLPELEFRAVTRHTFGKLKDKKMKQGKFSWGVLNVYGEKGCVACGVLEPACTELEAFQNKQSCISGYIGENTKYHSGGHTRVCRIISVKKTRKEVLKELKAHEKKVLELLKKPGTP